MCFACLKHSDDVIARKKSSLVKLLKISSLLWLQDGTAAPSRINFLSYNFWNKFAKDPPLLRQKLGDLHSQDGDFTLPWQSFWMHWKFRLFTLQRPKQSLIFFLSWGAKKGFLIIGAKDPLKGEKFKPCLTLLTAVYQKFHERRPQVSRKKK